MGRIRNGFLGFLFAWAFVVTALPIQAGNDPNACDVAGEFPDVAVTQLTSTTRWGTQDGWTAFSLQTTSCNFGTCWLEWIENNELHPVIAQNVYRVKNGRFQQLGQSWLKHGFFATSQDLCGICEEVPAGDYLGVNCSDPYDAFLNGFQPGLGPRYEVNAFTGDFPYPYERFNETGDTLDKRMNVRNTDLDPIQNIGSFYFVEGQYVAKDDAAAGRSANNISSRFAQVILGVQQDEFGLIPNGDVRVGTTALETWPMVDNTNPATVVRVPVPGEGQLGVGARVTQVDGDTWRYEYAVHNLNSHRSVEAFTVPVNSTANVQNVGFYAPEYHSGEIQENTPWVANVASWKMEWSTDDYEVNPAANAIRWGTLYNFWFDADVPPVDGPVTLRMWLPGRPGEPGQLRTRVPVPDICNNDGTCDFGEDCANCAADCPAAVCCGDGVCDPGETQCACSIDCGVPPGFEESCSDGIDNDCDGNVDCSDDQCCGLEGCGNGNDSDNDGFSACNDCDDGDANSWAKPEGTVSLTMDRPGVAQLNFGPPNAPGGTMIYDVLRAESANDFIRGTECLSPVGQSADDAEMPLPGQSFYYLVRGRNGCLGEVFMGEKSTGAERLGRACF